MSNQTAGMSEITAQSADQARKLIDRAYESQKLFASFSQERVDRIVESMVRAGSENALRLAAMAVNETGMGVVEDKAVKNRFATVNLYEYIRDMRTADVISRDEQKKVYEIAAPMGVVADIVPTTNPTSTVLFKSIISLKARNAVVFSPHPRAVRCSMEAARLMEEAAAAAGAPGGLVGCLSVCSKEATDELMTNSRTAVILATGGAAMVKAAYASGKPAYGVGPGNVPAFIERTADIPDAVDKIIASKTFDNGTICASEQAIVTENVVAEQVIRELMRKKVYFVSGNDRTALENTVIRQGGGVNPKVVGQSPSVIASLAGIKIPEGTKALAVYLEGVGSQYPLSAEKLCPVLAFYSEENWEKACERCIELLNYGGLGHSLVIHSKDDKVIMEFGLKKPVSRILVNTPSSQGAIGFTTALSPSLTLGCGTTGGNITSDNVTPMHLINKKRLAWHTSLSKM